MAELVRALREDPQASGWVAWAVGRADVPVADLAWAAEDEDGYVRRAYVERADLPVADLTWAAEDEDRDVRAAYSGRMTAPAGSGKRA